MSHHRPAGPSKNVGVVICPPLGWEAIQSYDALRLLGDRLAASGVPSFRVHYDGTGESFGGDRDPGRVEAWSDSIERAIEGCAGLPSVDHVVLVGLRMGALLAARVAERVAVRGVIFWEPCPTGAFYLRELEILAAASPDGPSGGGLLPGDLVATGHLVTAETAEALKGLDLSAARPHGSPDVLLLGRDDRPPPQRIADAWVEAGCSVEVDRLPGLKEMMIYPERSRPAEAFLDRIVRWTGDLADRSADESVVPETIESAAVHQGVLRRVRRFGDDRFGVAMELDSQGNEPRPGVLFLTGGVVPRTAMNRMYVEAAERLAAAGFVSLRVDVASIGESVPLGAVARSDAYPTELHEDTRAARDALIAETRGGPITLIGLCSGAFAAFRSAVSGPPPARLVLLNPLVLGDWADPRHAEEILTAEETRDAVTDGSRWKKLLTGQVDVLEKVGDVLGQLRHRVSGLGGRLATMAGGMPSGVPSEIADLLRQSVDVQVVFSEGDRGEPVFEASLLGARERLESEGLGVTRIPGADHTFNGLPAREALLDWLVRHVTGDAATSSGEPTAPPRS